MAIGLNVTTMWILYINVVPIMHCMHVNNVKKNPRKVLTYNLSLLINI